MPQRTAAGDMCRARKAILSLAPRPRESRTMKRQPSPFSDPASFLAKANNGRTISMYRQKVIIYSQGLQADSVHYIQRGKVKISVVSEQGKEAITAILGPGNSVFNEGHLNGGAGWQRKGGGVCGAFVLDIEVPIQGFSPDLPERSIIAASICPKATKPKEYNPKSAWTRVAE